MPPEIAKLFQEDQATRPKVLGMQESEFNALPEEEKPGYVRAERWGCGREDLGEVPCIEFSMNAEGESVRKETKTRSIVFFHTWNVWDEDGVTRWSRCTCVHGARWTGVVPCRECGSFDVMLSPYDPRKSKEEILERAKVELDARIRNIRGGYRAGKLGE